MKQTVTVAKLSELMLFQSANEASNEKIRDEWSTLVFFEK